MVFLEDEKKIQRKFRFFNFLQYLNLGIHSLKHLQKDFMRKYDKIVPFVEISITLSSQYPFKYETML